MDATQRKILLRAAICGWTALLAGSARAGNHTWDVNEVFSNFDGTIQFIELFESNSSPGEIGMPGQTISTNAHSFVLPGETLEPPTTNKFLLIATQAFADLPNAPTPDYIIPADSLPSFFSVTGDTIVYDIWDEFTFDAGVLPVDGVNSLSFFFATGPNSPTNYAGETGSVDAGSPPIPATSSWGLVIMGIMMAIAATILMARRRAIAA